MVDLANLEVVISGRRIFRVYQIVLQNEKNLTLLFFFDFITFYKSIAQGNSYSARCYTIAFTRGVSLLTSVVLHADKHNAI